MKKQKAKKSEKIDFLGADLDEYDSEEDEDFVPNNKEIELTNKEICK